MATAATTASRAASATTSVRRRRRRHHHRQGGDDIIHGDAGNDVIQAGIHVDPAIRTSSSAATARTSSSPGTTSRRSSAGRATTSSTAPRPTCRRPATRATTGSSWARRTARRATTSHPLLADDVHRQRHLRRRRRLRRDDRRRRRRHLRRQRRPGQDGRHVRLRLGDLQERPFRRHGRLGPRHLGGVGELSDHIASAVRGLAGSILDRFAEVEGLSGSAFTDILRGDDVDASTHRQSWRRDRRRADQRRADRAVCRSCSAASAYARRDAGFGTGNIILGGDGSDIIEGRGGDDLIDGDAWLNVRISVRANIDGTGPEIASFDSMTEMIPLMLTGSTIPGQLVAVREIMPGSQRLASIPRCSRATGRLHVSIKQRRRAIRDDIVTVTDNVAGRDGIDRLTHIERLQFADRNPSSLAPGSTPSRSARRPLRDTNGGDPKRRLAHGIDRRRDRRGQCRRPIRPVRSPDRRYVWQSESDAGSGVFEDIIIAARLAISPSRAPTAPPSASTPDLAGLVAAREGHLPGRAWRDGAGVLGADRSGRRMSPMRRRRRPPP